MSFRGFCVSIKPTLFTALLILALGGLKAPINRSFLASLRSRIQQRRYTRVTQQMQVPANSGRLEIDTSKLKAGHYVVCMQLNKKMVVVKNLVK
jgi:hypothetical protein